MLNILWSPFGLFWPLPLSNILSSPWPTDWCSLLWTWLPDCIHIFKPKIPLWVKFRGSCNGRCWYILRPFGMYILCPFDIYLWSSCICYPVLVCCTKKHLATLVVKFNKPICWRLFSIKNALHVFTTATARHDQSYILDLVWLISRQSRFYESVSAVICRQKPDWPILRLCYDLIWL
jgi:hypothetical protein